ncbi:hypothetical protein CYMTET_22108 [Cymbomonas tetramitiformis]|uniref:Uncharacterized protein n=1 Tax=Cymbomonas tetramitiformis TaxID=36881 RepID=A0AAE0G125_9CHLO|nr:hypothetical protein CYMTET_22108 [Cymbomonas tetramitiformis]
MHLHLHKPLRAHFHCHEAISNVHTNRGKRQPKANVWIRKTSGYFRIVPLQPLSQGHSRKGDCRARASEGDAGSTSSDVKRDLSTETEDGQNDETKGTVENLNTMKEVKSLADERGRFDSFRGWFGTRTRNETPEVKDPTPTKGAKTERLNNEELTAKQSNSKPVLEPCDNEGDSRADTGADDNGENGVADDSEARKTMNKSVGTDSAGVGEDSGDGYWARLQKFWDRPWVQRLRLSLSVLQTTVRLPTMLAFLIAQLGVMASTTSLPILAPLLLGSGMVLQQIVQNAGYVLPRMLVCALIAWASWFSNSLFHDTLKIWCQQEVIPKRLERTLLTLSEVSRLLWPASAAMVFASKDVLHNIVGGFFLFTAQPFRVGDHLSVPIMSSGSQCPWFEVRSSCLRPPVSSGQPPSTAQPPFHGIWMCCCNLVYLG